MKHSVSLMASACIISLGASLSPLQTASAATQYAGAVIAAPFPVFQVKSNGSSYTQLQTPALAFAFKINVDIEGDGQKIKGFNGSLRLKVRNPKNNKNTLINLDSLAPSDSFKPFQRPTSLHKAYNSSPVPKFMYENTMVKNCNRLADKLRGMGMSDPQIFSVNRTIPVSVEADVSVEWGAYTQGMVGSSSGTSVQSTKLLLTCAKTPGVTADTPAPQPNPTRKMQITKAKLTLQGPYKNATVNCPIQIPFKAEIKGTRAGLVKYRLHTASGKITKIYSVQLDKQGKGQKIIKIPVPTPFVGEGPSSGGVKPGASGKVQTGNGQNEGVIGGGVGGTKPGGLAGTSAASNLHKNAFRIETISPNKVVSNYSGFIIKCKPKPGPFKPVGGKKAN